MSPSAKALGGSRSTTTAPRPAAAPQAPLSRPEGREPRGASGERKNEQAGKETRVGSAAWREAGGHSSWPGLQGASVSSSFWGESGSESAWEVPSLGLRGLLAKSPLELFPCSPEGPKLSPLYVKERSSSCSLQDPSCNPKQRGSFRCGAFWYRRVQAPLGRKNGLTLVIPCTAQPSA